MDLLPYLLYMDLLQCQEAQYLAVALESFKDLLNRIAEKFETQKAMAEALDIDASRLTRALKKGDFPFNVENCLRLAKLSGESPSAILRAADKAEIADLIESLYGRDRTRLLTPAEREVLDRFATLPPEDLELARRLLNRFFSGSAKRQRRRTA
jgi:hypothetical protein